MSSLIIKHPGSKPEVFRLKRLRLTIGRSARNAICLADPFASRVHAEIRYEGDAYVLQDLGSANGTYYDGRRLDEAQPLVSGGTLRIGETELEFVGEDAFSTIAPADSSVTSVTTSLATIAPPFAAKNNTTSGLLEAIEEARRGQQSGASTNKSVQTTKHAGQAAQAATNGKSTSDKSDLLALIGKVGVTLLASATLDETLRQIVSLVFDVVPAERCLIMLRSTPNGDHTLDLAGNKSEPKTQLQIRAAATRNNQTGAAEPATTEIKISRTIIEEVMERGCCILATDAQHDPRFVGSTMTLEGIRSVLAVPLGVGKRAFGIIYADSPVATVSFTEDHLQVLTTLASVAAIRVENARLLEEQFDRERLEREIHLAREIQQRFQPAHAPVVEGYDMIGISFSCYEIGGDYYDFIRRPEDKMLIALGDVSGKGTAAALLMSSLHAAIHAQVCVQTTLTEIINAVNRYLADNTPPNRFVTLFLSELNTQTGELAYLNAGHNPPLVVRRSNANNAATCEHLKANGIPLGINADACYDEGVTQLNGGDVLVIYSDGVSETINPTGEEFGIARLREVVAQNMDLTAAGIRDRIESALTKFAGGTATMDDVTLIIVKRNV